MNTEEFSILRLIATVVVTIGVPAMVGLTWNMSIKLSLLARDHTELAQRVRVVEEKSGIMRVIVFGLVLGLVTGSAPGCTSHTQAIREGAQRIRTDADAARSDLAAAIDTGDVGPKALPHVRSADAKLQTLAVAAMVTERHADRVEDKGGGILAAFVRVLVWGLVIAAGALIVGAAIYAYVPILIGKLALWFPRMMVLIPRKIRDAGKLLMEAREEHPESSKLGEIIAAQRAASPTFDAVVRNIKKAKATPRVAGV